MYDLLIRGGRIVDGTGSPWQRGDVAITGDRIVAVGLMPAAHARDTIDASGLIVAPGFIDMLGHSEDSLLRDGRAISKITQGITSEVTGEASSVVPVGAASEREWKDLDGYFRALERARPAINLATFVTAGSARRVVMGETDRAPTADELEQMKRHVAEAMRQGAVGLSTGLIYAPAAFATTDELVELATVAATYGGGYASHIRSEGDRLIEAIREAIEIGERAGTWVQIHHLKASGRQNWGEDGGCGGDDRGGARSWRRCDRGSVPLPRRRHGARRDPPQLGTCRRHRLAALAAAGSSIAGAAAVGGRE